MSTPMILAFAGSLRKESFNKKLVQIAAQAAREAGAQVHYIDLRDFPLPIYDGDLEASEGIPPNGHKLKELFIGHDGFLIASPEYNSSISAVLKNAIDWVSRPVPNQPPLAGFTGKVAGIMAASPGALGGLRGLVHLRAILGNINTLVLPDQFALSKANEAFNPDGSLQDPQAHAKTTAIGRKLAEITRKLKN